MIRTVLGDVPAGDLGVCDAHDHLFFRSAQLPGHELAAVSRTAGVAVVAATGLHQAAHYGDQTLVQDVLPRLADLFTEELTTGSAPIPGRRQTPDRSPELG